MYWAFCMPFLDPHHHSAVALPSLMGEGPGLWQWEQQPQELGGGACSPPTGWQHCVLGSSV